MIHGTIKHQDHISFNKKMTLNVLDSVFSPSMIKDVIGCYGLTPIKYSHFTGIPCFKTTDSLWTSSIKMFNQSRKFQERANNYLLSLLNSVIILVRKVNSLPHKPIRIGLYTLLVSGKDGTPKYTHYKQPRVLDKFNHKEVYQLYRKFYRQVHRFIRRTKKVSDVISRPENPWHSTGFGRYYSHPHVHGLLASTYSLNQIKQLEPTIKRIFTRIFGYSPTMCNIQPLTWEIKHGSSIPVDLTDQPHSVTIKGFKSTKRVPITQHLPLTTKEYCQINSNLLALLATDMFVDYMETNFHIQTKDTDSEFLQAPTKQNYKKLHLVFNAQLNSSKGSRVHCIQNNTIKSLQKNSIQPDYYAQFKLVTAVPKVIHVSTPKSLTEIFTVIRISNEATRKQEKLVYSATATNISSIRISAVVKHTQLALETNQAVKGKTEPVALLQLWRLKPT